MKNRYGQDGMTYNLRMDTNNGHIEFDGEANMEDLENEDNKPSFNLSREKMAELFDKK